MILLLHQRICSIWLTVIIATALSGGDSLDPPIYICYSNTYDLPASSIRCPSLERSRLSIVGENLNVRDLTINDTGKRQTDKRLKILR